MVGVTGRAWESPGGGVSGRRWECQAEGVAGGKVGVSERWAFQFSGRSLRAVGVMDGRWECQGGDDRWQVGVSGRVGEAGVSGRWDLQVASGKVRVWGGK